MNQAVILVGYASAGLLGSAVWRFALAFALPGIAGTALGLLLFARIDHVRFRRPVVPGDTLRLETRLTDRRRQIGRGEGKAYVGSDLVCSGTLTFAIAEL